MIVVYYRDVGRVIIGTTTAGIARFRARRVARYRAGNKTCVNVQEEFGSLARRGGGL